MSAPIVVHGTGQIIENPGKSAWAMDGYAERAMTYRVPGQLWERVAEMGEAGVVNSPNYTARIADAFRIVRRARSEYRVGMLNVSTIQLTPAGECMFYREMDARYGTSKASPLHHSQRCPIHHYVHTGFECGAL